MVKFKNIIIEKYIKIEFINIFGKDANSEQISSSFLRYINSMINTDIWISTIEYITPATPNNLKKIGAVTKILRAGNVIERV